PFLADKPTSPFPAADQGLMNGGRPAQAPAPTQRDTEPAPDTSEDDAAPADETTGEQTTDGEGNGNGNGNEGNEGNEGNGNDGTDGG
ncbi:MAG TPA: hypothetical protein VGB58_06530, partial [Blastococcus sp.]